MHRRQGSEETMHLELFSLKGRIAVVLFPASDASRRMTGSIVSTDDSRTI